jgi:uncharacterized membrane protein
MVPLVAVIAVEVAMSDRARAERCRRIAIMHDTPLSERLLYVALDLEAQAAALQDKMEAQSPKER